MDSGKMEGLTLLTHKREKESLSVHVQSVENVSSIHFIFRSGVQPNAICHIQFFEGKEEFLNLLTRFFNKPRIPKTTFFSNNLTNRILAHKSCQHKFMEGMD